MEQQEKLFVTLLKVLAAIAPVVVFLYLEEPRFRWAVDEVLAQLRYRAQHAEWRARVWDRLQGWQRELWEQRHGLPER